MYSVYISRIIKELATNNIMMGEVTAYSIQRHMHGISVYLGSADLLCSLLHTQKQDIASNTAENPNINISNTYPSIWSCPII